jgi:hypothetical protein
VAKTPPDKLDRQIQKAGLPTGGQVPFVPRLDKNRKGEDIIRKATVQEGPKKGKKGFVDTNGRIWIKDRAHAGDPDHWDVQEDAGATYFRVDLNGNKLITPTLT